MTHSSFPFYWIDCESRMPNMLHAAEKPHYKFKCLWHCRTAACAMLYNIHLVRLHWWVHSWVWVIPFQILNICSFISASHYWEEAMNVLLCWFFRWPNPICSKIRTRKKLLNWWKNHSFIFKSISVGIELSIFLGIYFLAK